MGADIPLNAQLLARRATASSWIVLFSDGEVVEQPVGYLRLDGWWFFMPAGATEGVKFDSFNQAVKWLRFNGELKEGP